MKTIFHLFPSQFTDHKTLLAECSELTASVFRYPSGVFVLRLKDVLSELGLLPYHGR